MVLSEMIYKPLMIFEISSSIGNQFEIKFSDFKDFVK